MCFGYTKTDFKEFWTKIILLKANAVDPGLQLALQAFLGSSNDHVVRVDHESQKYGDKVTATMEGATKGSEGGPLFAEGFARIQTFALIPSAMATRWIIPIGNRRWTFRALNVCTVYAPGARFLKQLLLATTWMGWTGWARHTLLVSSQQPLTVESLVSEVTGEPHPVFALSLGSPSRFRKLTIQVMRQDGEVLGYLKLPMTQESVARVRREVVALEYLSRFPALQLQIPRVLYAGEWGGGYILFQSAGPSNPAPAEFGAPHQEFLKNLRSVDSIEKPGEALVAEIGSRWRKTERDLDSKWRALGSAALQKASHELEDLTVRCGITHGDFTPWNCRVGGGRLYVFDWELASFEAPISWDVFHFHVQVAFLLKKNKSRVPPRQTPQERGCFLLYLLNSVCQCLEEEPLDAHVAVNHRRILLLDELSEA